MTTAPIRIAFSTAVALGWLVFGSMAAVAQTRVQSPTEFDRIAERYWQVLHRNPRKGTALDLWRQHYANAGKLGELQGKVEQAIASDPAAAQPRLLRALLLERDRKPAEAILEYERAERLAPDNYYPVFCRGMLLFQQQRFRDASTALEQALEMQPPRSDLEDAVQALVRCLMRAGDRDRARRTWEKYAADLAGDVLAVRQLAEAVTSEGDAEAAIELWRQVIEHSPHDLAAVTAAEIEIAQLCADQGKAEIAVDRFGRTLTRLKPGSWLARDICRRIERIFLEREDIAGLVAFWKGRSAEDPQDLQTLERLARSLGLAGRVDESLATYRKALQAAPKDGGLRRSYIDALVETRRFEEAVDQCETLLVHAGSDTDVLRMLAQLHLKASPAEAQTLAQDRAIETWRRIAQARPSDPAAALQAAEACRHAARIPTTLLRAEEGLPVTGSNARLLSAAEAFYREAVRRAGQVDPERAAPYLEYLGEFLHAIKRPDDAVAAWEQICAPPNDSPELLFEAAAIFVKHGCLAEAQEVLRRALERDPRSFLCLEFLINVLLEQGEFQAAFERLAELDAVAEDPTLRDRARRLRLQVCAAGEFTEKEIERLRKAVVDARAAVDDLWLLGLLLSQQRRYEASQRVLARALDSDGANSRLIHDYATALERSGKFAETIAQYEKLITVEPHHRAAHYRSIARLHVRRGEFDLARQTAEKLVQLAPKDAGAYLLCVEVTRWLGDREGQADLLRRAVRAAPRDPMVRRQLARALAELGDYEASLDEFWQCWEMAPTLPERISLVAAMSDMLAKTGSQLPLLDRLQTVRDQHPRDVALCLAEAYRRMGEFDQTRRVLTSLLTEDGRDVDVLQQLAALAAGEEDWGAALAYQQQVVILNGGWSNVLDWVRYYSQSKRGAWLAEARGRQRRLMRSWAETYHQYRAQMDRDNPDPSRVAALRQELVNLDWARNKYYEKEQALDPDARRQHRFGDEWMQIRLDFEILELASHSPVKVVDVERRLAERLGTAGVSAEAALDRLCQKELLRKTSPDGVEHFSAALPASELLRVALRDFGQRMLGAEIELSEVELVKLDQIVRSAAAAREPPE